jgi:hypothetical protein
MVRIHNPWHFYFTKAFTNAGAALSPSGVGRAL